MEQVYPLLREVCPELVDDLVAQLTEQGETELAVAARDLRLVEQCDCGDSRCQSVRTAPHPPDEPYGEGYRNVLLCSPTGMMALDVVGSVIMYVEVIFRGPMPEQDDERDDPDGQS